jgi:hypothetical protein
MDDQVWAEEDLRDLHEAKRRLEYPSLTARLADLLGGPIEAGLKRLPGRWSEKVGEATEAALLKGLEFSIHTMGRPEARPSRDRLHKRWW